MVRNLLKGRNLPMEKKKFDGKIYTLGETGPRKKELIAGADQLKNKGYSVRFFTWWAGHGYYYKK